MDFEGALTSVERGPGDQRQQAIVTLTPGAEEGADNIEGGTGNDWLFGQGQADVLRGDGGETEGDAGPGSCDDGIDNVGSSEGADSNDDSECDGGDDDLIGGSHDDDMFGGPGADIMLGDDGFVDHANTAARADDSAVLIGAPDEGADDMNGEAEDDKMYGQGGQDTMNGGGGGDRMNARARPSRVIPNQTEALCERLIEMIQRFPYRLHMAQRGRRHHKQGRPFPRGGEGDIYSIARLRVLDARLHDYASGL